MANVQDFIFDSNDLKIANGDIVIGASDNQHIEDIFMSDKGHFRQYPTIGIGVRKMILGNGNLQFIRKVIKTNLEFDNFDITDLVIRSTEDINVRAERIK